MKRRHHDTPGEPEELYFNTEEIKTAELLYRAINHKLRIQILRLIHERKEITVMTIYTAFNIPQSLASQQLAILRKAGLVGNFWKDRTLLYYIDYNSIKKVKKYSDLLLQG